jgi:hypothetical protein
MTSTIGLSGLGPHLREWTDADLPVMAELFDDPEVSRWARCRPSRWPGGAVARPS